MVNPQMYFFDKASPGVAILGLFLATTAFAQDKGEVSPAGMHDHHQHHHAQHDQGGAPAAGYIRVTSPAGYRVVLGRANPLPVLAYETVRDVDGGTVKLFRLTVKDVDFDIFPDKPMRGWGFNGTIPGPTIRVTQGDRVRIVLSNETDTPHTLHVHGQIKPVRSDGVPYLGQKPVHKGETYTYDLTANAVGTHWYHCHYDAPHHVDMGMYGAFIVEPKKETLVYDREYIMLLDEWPTGHVHVHHQAMPVEGHEEHGVVTIHPGEQRHDHGEERPQRDYFPETYPPHDPIYDAFTVNGRAFPYTEPLETKSGEKIRIRFINAGNQTHMMHLHAHKFRVVARDGSPVDEPQLVDVVPVGSSQRIDVMVNADNPGIWPFHCHRLNHVTNDHVYPGGMLAFLRYTDFQTPDSDVKLTKHVEASLFQRTAKGLYSVELLANEGAVLRAGNNNLQIIIHNYRDVDVEGATLSVVAERGSGKGQRIEAPAAIDQGRGLYVIYPLTLPAGGPWTLHVAVDKDGVVDRAMLEVGRTPAE